MFIFKCNLVTKPSKPSGSVLNFIGILTDCAFQNKAFLKQICIFFKKYFILFYSFKKVDCLSEFIDLLGFYLCNFFLSYFFKKYTNLFLPKFEKIWFLYGFGAKKINTLRLNISNSSNFKTKFYISLWNSIYCVSKIFKYLDFGFNVYINSSRVILSCYYLYKHITNKKLHFCNKNDYNIADNFYFSNCMSKKILTSKLFFILGKFSKNHIFSWGLILFYTALDYRISAGFWKFFLFFSNFQDKTFYLGNLKKIKIYTNLVFRLNFFKFFYQL